MEERRVNKGHVMVLPFHGQGHMNPMLQFSKRLAYKGVKVTIATTLSNTKTMLIQAASIRLEAIYDDISEGGITGPGGFKGFLERFEAGALQNLPELIKKQENAGYPVKCLVYDANLPLALDIAKQLGLAGAAFFTQSCSAIACYYPMHKELSGEPLEGPPFSMPGMPPLKFPNLPSMGSASGKDSPILRYILSQFSNIESADWVLFNSFDKLEAEVVKWMATLWPVRTIGPTLPSLYLDKRVKGDESYGFSLFEQNGETCLKWLNEKETGSVIYVSFGSAAQLSPEQMEELAWGLKQSNKNFLWVVRASEESKLPSKFMEETSDKGLVLTWCSQLEVLAHPAMGCFITHCGWNSTVEAVSFGVPMVGMPQFLDQMTNAYFVGEIWRVGVRARVNEQGIATREEIQQCIREVMQGEGGHEIKRNATMFKELAKEAVDEGGSSDNNIEEIIAQLGST